MKTLTEFAAINLKNALDKKKELTAAGKTAEELPAALGEALKLEGDKLTFMVTALDLVGEKLVDLKRVVVASLNEGETAPSGAKLVGEKYYTVEYYTLMRQGGADQGRDEGRRGGKGGKGGKGDKRGGGRGPGGPGGDRGARGPGGSGGPGAGRGPRPMTAGSGKLPVPNKVASKPAEQKSEASASDASSEQQS